MFLNSLLCLSLSCACLFSLCNGRGSHKHHNFRGRGRGRGSALAQSVTTFIEEFDFTAMNEKFLTKMKSGVILVRNPSLGKKMVSWEMMCLMKTWRLRKQATQSWMSSLFMSKMTFLIPYLVEHLDVEGHMGGAGFLNVGGWTQKHLVIFQGTGSPMVVVPMATVVVVGVKPVVHTTVAEATETWGWVAPLEMLILIVDTGEIDAVN